MKNVFITRMAAALPLKGIRRPGLQKLMPLLGLLFYAGIGLVHAQSTVTGRVTSAQDGAGLPGVSVIVKGTNAGVSTDGTGNYSIRLPESGATLIFSYIGFMPQEIQPGNRTTLNVALAVDSKNLQEVVVTALGIERSARSLTYSTQQIEGKQLTDVRDANFVNTLSGKVAGLVVTQGASGPGSATRVTLRGNRSIRGNNNALFVVDGVPIDNSVRGQVGSDFGGVNGNDGASNINPDDIESMNILKGAAASALYGSRAANGVIMITTKKGKAGKVSTDINSGVVVENPFLLPEFQNTYGQGAGGVANDKANGSWGVATSTYPNNVRDFFRTGVSTNNSIGVSAGTEKVQSYLSYTNNYNQGLVPNNDMNRHTLNLRINTQISKRFSTDGKITYVKQVINNKPRSGEESAIIMNLYKIPRSVDLAKYEEYQDANGFPTYWTTSSIYMNPYWTINKTSSGEDRSRMIVLGSAKYEFTDWLNIQGRVSFDRYDDRTIRRWANRTLLFARPGGAMEDFADETIERNLDVILSGNNNLSDDLSLSYNFGGGSTYQKFSRVGAFAEGLLVPDMFDLSFARALTQRTGFSEKELQYVFGTAALSYRGYLNLDVAARNDWSSTLPAPHSYFYPSVGANVIVSEMFTLPKFISFGKVRASWAQVGNDTDPYLLTQTYSFTQGGTGGYVFRDAVQPAIDLKPEISSSTELGVDFRFLNGRLGIDATYYNSNTVNQLLNLDLAPASGFSSQFINAGKIKNEGFEIALTGSPVSRGNFNWDMALNVGRNVNTIVELHPDIKIAFLAGGYGRTAGPVIKEGGSYGDLYAQRWKRDDQGRFVVDANGKPVATPADKVGNFNPKATVGFNNAFSFGNFVANFLIDARIGGEMTSGTEANLAFDGNAPYTVPFRSGNWVLPAVTATGETNTKPINAETFWTTVSGGRYSWGEFFTYSTTNVRLREVSVGYNIPTSPGFFIQNARISFVARNLLFLYRGWATLDIPGIERRKLPFDPDVNLGAGNFQGVEYGNLPSSRTMGLNLKFSF